MYVQIIEGRTSNPERLRHQGERWQEELRPGAAGFLGVTSGTTADGRAVTIVRFETAAAARSNSDRPEQGAWWAETAGCYHGDPAFTESGDVEELLGGGSNDAGFVQVMKITAADRSRFGPLDQAMPRLAELRPDLLGACRIWTGPTACVQVGYFTSEAEARAGERKEIPADLQPTMAQFQEIARHAEYLDLPDPQLF
ncbi:MAG: hypothetical protein ACRDZR_03845 [Acidimicrobiales bacterium]